MPMNQELKKALWWMAPINFDGNPVGAFVRTAETVAVGIGTILALHSFGADCGGPIAVGTLIIMGGQFAGVPRHNREHRSALRKFWSIRPDPPDED